MEKKNKKKLLGGLLFLTLYLLLLVLAAQIAPEAVLLLLGVSALFTVVEVHTLHQNKIKRTILQQERDRLRQILNHIPLPLFLVTEQHCLNFVNTIALELFHCKDDVVGQPCHCLNTSICHTAECAIEKMEQTGNGRTYYDMDGKSYMVSTASLEKETDNNGKYIEIIQDITEVVEAQRSLEEKTLELETMSENLIGGVLITTMDEGFPVIRCNQSYRDMVQKPDEQILGQGAMQWVAAEDALKLTQKIRQQLAQGNSVNLEYHLHCQNNVVIWVSLRGKRAVLRGAEVGVWFLTDISSRKEAELALKIEEERYRIAMQSVEDIIIDYDMKTHIMYHSSKAKEIYGVPEIMKNMPQSILDRGTVLAESRKEYLDLFRQLAAGTAKCSCILRARAADGRSLWNRLTFTAIFDNEGNTVRAIGILQDITKEKSVELQYKREARYLDLEGKEGTFYYEADMTHHCFISGHEPIVNSYCDQPIDDFDTVVELLTTHMVYEPDRDFVRRQTSWAAIMSGYDAGILRKSVEYRRSINGELTWASCSMQTFFDEETQSLHCVGCIRNINEMKEKEISLQQRAERDLLTGLYNKVTTEMLIQSAVGEVSENAVGAFLLIDLDNFKNVNDTLGHAVGDIVISQVAKGLVSLFRQEDIVGRIGGDEFAVYMNRVKDEQLIRKKAGQIREMFHSIGVGATYSYGISGSIGIAMVPWHGKNFDELYQNADRAMYYAKGQGKDNYAIFRAELPTMGQEALEK